MDTKRLVMAGGLALCALIIFTQLRRLGTPPASNVDAEAVVEKVEYADVLVASQDLPFGAKVNDSTLKWVQWPVDSVSPQFIVSNDNPEAMSDYFGAVVRTTIYAGEPIIDKKLVNAGDSGVLAALLKPGMRAVATPISVDTTAGGFIQPGDRVDIILTQQKQRDALRGNGRTENYVVASTIFQNVNVLAIDQTYSKSPEGIEGEAALIGSTATFEMTQGDAEILRESATKGDITLTLRGIDDARSRYARSASTVKRGNNSEAAQITIYRDGRPQYVAIKGN